MNRIKTAIVFLILISISGCANVPLLSKLKLATYDETDVLSIVPEDIRIQAKINHALHIDLSNATKISLGLMTENGGVELPLLLKLTKTEIEPATDSFFSNTPEFDVSTLVLSEPGIEKFKELQLLLKDKSIEGGSFSAGLNLDSPHVQQLNEPILFSVAIALDSGQDYLTLIENVNISEQMKQPDKP